MLDMSLDIVAGGKHNDEIKMFFGDLLPGGTDLGLQGVYEISGFTQLERPPYTLGGHVS